MYRIILTIGVLLALSFGIGQEAQSNNEQPIDTQSTNPIVRLGQFIDQVSSSEEHLLHKEKVGPYTVNADGQRLVKHPYLRFDITKEGEALAEDATVVMESKLYVHTKDPLIRTYTAVREGDSFLVDPLDLSSLKEVDHTYGGWMEFDLIISEGGSNEQGDFGLDYYSPRPDVGLLFRLINTLIPVVVLVLAFGFFKMRGLRRNQSALTSV